MTQRKKYRRRDQANGPKNADTQAYGGVLRTYRQALNRSQEDIALQAQVAMGTVSEIENGLKSPNFDTLRAMLRVLQKTLANFEQDVEVEKKSYPDNPNLSIPNNGRRVTMFRDEVDH